MNELEQNSGEEPKNPWSSLAQFNLFLYSTVVFIFTALIAQFLLTTQTALLLKRFAISFIYTPFWIQFSSIEKGNWTPIKINIVFFIGYLVYFLLGLVLLTIRTNSWKVNLWLVWGSFYLIHTFATGIFSAIFFFDGFGIGLTYIITDMISRSILAFIAIVVLLAFGRFWAVQFLKSAYSRSLIVDDTKRITFMRNILVLPWLAGSILLILFGFPHHSWSWMLTIAGLGIFVLPISTAYRFKINFRLHRTESIVFRFTHFAFFALVLLLLWLLSYYYRISF